VCRDCSSELRQAADAYTASNERLGPPAIVVISETGQILRHENLLDSHPYRSEDLSVCASTQFRRDKKSFRSLKSELLVDIAAAAKAAESNRYFHSLFMTVYLHFQDNSDPYPESNFLHVTNRRTKVGTTLCHRAMINFLHASMSARMGVPYSL
jgi:hypothetical protein